MSKQRSVSAWLWAIGLVCLLLPYFWWPRPFGWRLLTYGVISVAILSWVVGSGEAGGPLDLKRSSIRGVLGVIAYAGVLFGGILSYRAFVF